jgi:hypothetical protein
MPTTPLFSTKKQYKKSQTTLKFRAEVRSAEKTLAMIKAQRAEAAKHKPKAGPLKAVPNDAIAAITKPLGPAAVHGATAAAATTTAAAAGETVEEKPFEQTLRQYPPSTPSLPQNTKVRPFRLSVGNRRRSSSVSEGVIQPQYKPMALMCQEYEQTLRAPSPCPSLLKKNHAGGDKGSNSSLTSGHNENRPPTAASVVANPTTTAATTAASNNQQEEPVVEAVGANNFQRKGSLLVRRSSVRKTRPVEPNFCLEERAKHRQEAEKQWEHNREAAQAEDKKCVEWKLRESRKHLEFKAQPILKSEPIEIRTGLIPPTVPKSPKMTLRPRGSHKVPAKFSPAKF